MNAARIRAYFRRYHWPAIPPESCPPLTPEETQQVIEGFALMPHGVTADQAVRLTGITAQRLHRLGVIVPAEAVPQTVFKLSHHWKP